MLTIDLALVASHKRGDVVLHDGGLKENQLFCEC